MRVDCLKGKEYTNEYVIEDKIKINNDISISIKDIPVIDVMNGRIHYTQIGMMIYIVYRSEAQKITYIYLIEQAIEKNNLKIANIYTTTIVDKENILERFFRYDEAFEKETLTEKLFMLIDRIPVIIEKAYLQAKISEYLENNDVEIVKTYEEIEDEVEVKTFPKKSLYEQVKFDFKDEIKEKSMKPLEKNEGMQSKKKEILYNGKKYKSIVEFVKEFDLVYNTANKYFVRGLTPEEVIEECKKAKRKKTGGRPDAIKIICNGIKYNSMNEFAVKNNVSSLTVSTKLKQGKTPEQILEESNNATRGGAMIPKKVTYKGVEYPSVTALAKFLNVSQIKLNALISESGNVDDIVDNYLKEPQNKNSEKNKYYNYKGKVDEATKGMRNLKYEYEGEMFTIKELAELVDIPHEVMWDRLRRSRWSVQKAVEPPYIKKI